MKEKANSGHPGGAMGGSDFINVLFSEYLVYDPADPTWTGRDLSLIHIWCTPSCTPLREHQLLHQLPSCLSLIHI